MSWCRQDYLSDDKRVMLKSLTLKSSGMYRCEVSAEAPGFSSASGEGRMEVICNIDNVCIEYTVDMDFF